MAQTQKSRPLVLDIFAQSRYKNALSSPPSERTVPMSVLCLGLSRTGTQSLREALFQLGYDDIYHQTSLNIDRPSDANLWIQTYKKKFEDQQPSLLDRKWFDEMLGGCMAATDVPCISFWRELMDAYPEAKIILTVRDSEEVWYGSFMESCMGLLGSLYGNTWIGFLQRRLWAESPGHTYAKMLLRYDEPYRVCFSDYEHGTREGVKIYEEHNQAVLDYAKEQDRQVLVFNVKEGWDPIVKFLGVERPSLDFPRLNDREYYRAGTRKIQYLVVFGVTVQTVVLLAPVAVAWYLWRRWH